VILTLEITGPQPTNASGARRQTFRSEGGTIGRDTDNSWVLPHSKVSARHAVISYSNGSYYIEDKSRNGVCLNSLQNRLVRDRPYVLKSDDVVLIDPYEIGVSVTPDQNDAAPLHYGAVLDERSSNVLGDRSSPFDSDDPFAPRPIPSAGMESPGAEIASQLDPLELLNLLPVQGPARKAPSAKDLEFGSALEEHYRPPLAVPAPAPPHANPIAIPHDYDPLAPDDAPPVSLPPPQRAGRGSHRSAQQRGMSGPSGRSPVSMSEESSAQEHIRTPPVARPNAVVIPQDYDPLAPDDARSILPVSSPAPRPVERAQNPPLESRDEPLPIVSPPVAALATNAPAAPGPAPVATGADPSCSADFANVLAGAGLDPSGVTPEVARDFGQILRVVVSGVMDVMRSRQQIKDEFRMRMTRFKTTENNPLKFSANVDDALHNLLVKRNPGYLPAVEAFEDAFIDLRNHQIAMLAGMRVAFESMLSEFDPDRLQQEFDRQLSKGLVPAKLRYWDLYRERREDIVKDPEATFRRLFGEQFARAYEDQLRELKEQESSAKRAASRTRKPSDT
jgi:type VI secretion system FHA domain protein